MFRVWVFRVHFFGVEGSLFKDVEVFMPCSQPFSSSKFFAVFASSFCIPGKPSHGTQRMEFSSDSRWGVSKSFDPNQRSGPVQQSKVVPVECGGGIFPL